jgi:hypothetical protein
VPCLLLIPLLTSCGQSDEKGRITTVVTAQELKDEGLYRAILAPLNAGLGHQTSGTFEIRIKEDDLSISSSVSGAPALVKHYQHLMEKKACPESDANQDGVLDFAETLSAAGPILIPIDSDLSNQLVGMDFGPIANGTGTYIYRRSTNLTLFLEDLSQPDPDQSDAVGKMSPGGPISLDGRVVMVFGVNNGANLPSTAAGYQDESPELMTPIACGALVRVTDEDP